MYDVIVVGGGHAGIEAAALAARLGLEVALVTMQSTLIGHMSCNPAIGGLAKGHLVCEVDALGGVMGGLADMTAVQYRMLNIGKGPAVWSPRTQNDRDGYRQAAQRLINGLENLDVIEGEVSAVLATGPRADGVRLATGQELSGQAIILTTGTFLGGLIHIGLESARGGRLGEAASNQLSESLRSLGFALGRLKTGTSPRINGGTVDFSRMKVQAGDETPRLFSFRTQAKPIDQLPCFVTQTNEKTHGIIERNLARSPLYRGRIKGIGPRYCPSIEDKIHRFPDRASHLLFIEPEGRNTSEYYINGLSTSLPEDVQPEMVHSIVGLEKAEIVKPGYAVEYDFVFPTQLEHSLETKKLKRLFLAGQINGTSGYEEAAVQGFVAGINACRSISGRPPFILGRHEAYIGVLIDDLVLKGTEEPYRMFTSRAEHRLLLRIDNVLERLMPYGRDLGLITRSEYDAHEARWRTVTAEILRLKSTRRPPAQINPVLADIGEPLVTEHAVLADILKRPAVHYDDIKRMNGADVLSDRELGRSTEIRIKYEGYIRREAELAQRLVELESRKVPEGLDYSRVPGLSNEAKAKLDRLRPRSLAQVSRISGITPSDVTILFYYLAKGGHGV